MSTPQQSQKMLNWLESERAKDKKQLESEKIKFAQQIKKLKKEDIFPKPKTLTLWQKIKILFLGN